MDPIFFRQNLHQQQSSSQLGAGFDVETFNQDYAHRGNYTPLQVSISYNFVFSSYIIEFKLFIRIIHTERIPCLQMCILCILR